SFGLKPALGRLLTESDDRTPGAHPYAVLSHDYWARRFGQDPKAVGRTFRMGKDLYEIVGVLEQGFTGTEPGTVVDVWVPTMMNASAIGRPYSWWFRAFVHIAPGASPGGVRSRLEPPFQAFQSERSRTLTGMPPERRKQVLSEKVTLQPAATGTSNLQRKYRIALRALAVLVALVLLIACANVANLMLARAAARAREMALRVSIGAGRWRLVRLGLIESALIAVASTLLGGFFALGAAPFVVARINPPDNPARLHLPFDWRLWAFSLALALGVTLLFGLLPALRASSTKPAAAIKGGEDPRSRGRLMHGLIAAQVAFCVLVLLVSGLFVSSYDRLAKEPTGFAAEGLLALSTVTSQPELPVHWTQVAAHLRTVPGVESVAIAGWALMANQTWDNYVSVNGGPVTQVTCKLLHVSPGWLETMKIPLLRGRDLRHDDAFPNVAIVNEAFARTFMGGADPVGKSFAMAGGGQQMRIVGMARDARYEDPRTPMQPVAYFPFASINSRGLPDPRGDATLLVRTTTDEPGAVAASLRQQVVNARSTFRVNNIRTQQEIIDQHTIRERLLAMLALFFAAVALVLACVGLFGVLDYSVLQRRREIGIRLAMGAPASAVLRSVTAPTLLTVAFGAGVGLLLGRAAEHSITTLLHGVTASDPAVLVAPTVVLGAAALLAALPPALRAIRIDPVQTLRSE
ncbi:MAG TPA: ADOP family duplicated permease, partial [Bryobacteraceae bacterium]|nr:ADOP family duplicated permease [Bryobacteraceae bacterium]